MSDGMDEPLLAPSPPPSPPPPLSPPSSSSKRVLHSFKSHILRSHISRRQVVVAGVVVCALVAALSVAVRKGFLQHSSDATKDKDPTRPNLFESWKEEEAGTSPVSASSSKLGHFVRAGVSADGKPCAQIATDVLRRNGSAADATIAGLVCMGVVNAHSMGLGGGFLLTYYERSSGKAYALNAREVAPSAASEDMYHGDADLIKEGGLSVGVPGEVRGYRALYERFGGKVPWGALLQPSIRLCEEGHPVNWHMARALRHTRHTVLQEPSMSVFVNPDTGDVYKEGDVLKRPQLAKTLRVLQESPDALNTGPLADQLAGDMRELGGTITAQDLSNYEPEWREAINVSLQNGDLRMLSVPPPGSGLILGLILNILDEYDMTPRSMSEGQKILTHHRVAEAMKWSFAKRSLLGDLNYVNITQLIVNLTSDAFAASVQRQIVDDQTFQDPRHYGASTPAREDRGTAHFSLLAANGDAVAVTSTINYYFGARTRSRTTGIVFNDQMDDFSAPGITNFFGVPPSPPNFIRPGKRPLSSMCPAIFLDSEGEVRLVIGAAGGTKIISSVAWAALNTLWLGKDIKDAIDAPRIHHQLLPMTLALEEGTPPDVVAGLQQLGHHTQVFSVGGSVVCAVARHNGSIYASADFRKAGQVDGF